MVNCYICVDEGVIIVEKYEGKKGPYEYAYACSCDKGNKFNFLPSIKNIPFWSDIEKLNKEKFLGGGKVREPINPMADKLANQAMNIGKQIELVN